MEGSEPPFFTRFFKWDSAKSAVSFTVQYRNYMTSNSLKILTIKNSFLRQMLGNSYQRKIAIMKNGGTPPLVVSHQVNAAFTIMSIAFVLCVSKSDHTCMLCASLVVVIA